MKVHFQKCFKTITTFILNKAILSKMVINIKRLSVQSETSVVKKEKEYEVYCNCSRICDEVRGVDEEFPEAAVEDR